MEPPDLLQYAAFLLIVAALIVPVGNYLARVCLGEPTLLTPIVQPAEQLLYRLFGVDPHEETDWKAYTFSFIAFSLIGTLLLYTLLRLQYLLPGGPDRHFLSTPLTPNISFNTAVSFSTTTTWQAYGGESTLRYWTQMLGLAAQNFMAGAGGLALGFAFLRGFSRRHTNKLGNFWMDVTRALLYVLIPIALIGSLALVFLGVPQNFQSYARATTLEGGTQIIAQGPVAALEFIKNLGTNGGGFFNVNGAHPYENPSPMTNLIEMLAIVVLPAAFTYAFGRVLHRPRLGWTLLGVMFSLFIAGLLVCGGAEQAGVPSVHSLHVFGGNMEGKEVRFGVGGSVLTAIVTSNGATGSYNSMHELYTPIGFLVPLVNMLLGEIVLGGLGTGLYSMVMTALVGLFLAGLMVGRTPEFVGKTVGRPK